MKFRCTVCGHVYDEEKEGVKFADLPADWKCPICKQPKSKFEPIDETADLTWASEHKIGIASDLSDDMKDFLRAEFAGECSEVGMYLAMSRAAIRQGYPEVGAFYRQAAFEEADHASRYAEMLGEVVSASTKANLEARVAAENGACAGKTAFATRWPATRQGTARASRDCWTDISNNMISQAYGRSKGRLCSSFFKRTGDRHIIRAPGDRHMIRAPGDRHMMNKEQIDDLQKF